MRFLPMIVVYIPIHIASGLPVNANTLWVKAKLLQSKEGDAGLCVERLGFLPDGQAVEFCRSYFRGDMYDFVAELSAG